MHRQVPGLVVRHWVSLVPLPSALSINALQSGNSLSHSVALTEVALPVHERASVKQSGLEFLGQACPQSNASGAQHRRPLEGSPKKCSS
jgi:hypothetical protein